MMQEFSSDTTQSGGYSVAVYSVVPGQHTTDDLNQYMQA